MAKTILSLIDENVDGNGTDVTVLVEIEGGDITDEIINGVSSAIEKFKDECDEYTTDDCCDAAGEYLESKGFSLRWLSPERIITF